MSDVDLNVLVELGKDDVLAFAQKAAGNCFVEAPVLSRLFFLSLGGGRAELDAGRTRALLIDENEEVLSGVAVNTDSLLAVMAQAAGRVSQIGACIEAGERVLHANEEEGPEKRGRIQGLLDVLKQAERACVKIRRDGDGGFSLLPLGGMDDEAMAVRGAGI